jgi:hypothetical protein
VTVTAILPAHRVRAGGNDPTAGGAVAGGGSGRGGSGDGGNGGEGSGGGALQEIGMDGDDAGGRAELWPALYEKAYARLRGGYPALGFGSAADGLRTVTGRPVARRRAGGTDVATLAALLGRGEVVTVTTRERTGPGGLVASHAYAVLAADAAHGRVLLRNPWDPPPGGDGQRWYSWSAVLPDTRVVVHGPTR